MGLSNKIRELRFNHGEMTQKQLAERVGVSRQTMNAIENSRRVPTIDVAIRIADLFHISVDQVFDFDYAGRPARRERTTTISVGRPKASAEEPAEVESGDESAETEAEKEISFESLRRVIGP